MLTILTILGAAIRIVLGARARAQETAPDPESCGV